MPIPRHVERLITGVVTSDGAGVTLTRVLTGKLHRRLDPFLMLDAFGSDDPEDYIGGFPDHPHRGFETITYMLAGRMRHRDSAGHEGLLQNGGVQWMVAGRGIIHSELPEQQDGRMEGFQLWLNLPAADKLRQPWYRDIPSDSIPQYTTPDGVTVRVIAGECGSVAGAVQRPVTEPLYLDIHLPGNVTFTTTVPASHHAFAYVYRGAVSIENSLVPAQNMAVLGDGEQLSVHSDDPARLILVAGKPLNQPIAQYGPFVMTSEAEIQQAIEDYRSGRMG